MHHLRGGGGLGTPSGDLVDPIVGKIVCDA